MLVGGLTGNTTVTNLTVLGASGTFAAGADGGSFVVTNISNTANSATSRATLDLSAVAFVNINQGSSGIIGIGTGLNGAVGNGPNGTMTLGASNTLAAGTLRLSYGSTNAGTNNLRLGLVNTLNFDTILIGSGKGTGNLLFSPGLVNPSVTLRGFDGVSPVNLMKLSDYSDYTAGGASTNSSGVVNFSGGNVDALINTLSIGIGRISGQEGGTATASGSFTFDKGNVVVNNAAILGQSGGGSGAGAAETGTLNVNGTGQMTISPVAAPGTSVLTLSAAGGMTGVLNVSGGSLTLGGDIADSGGTSTINLASGQINMQGNNIGSSNSSIDTVTVSGTVRNFASLWAGVLSGTATGHISPASGAGLVTVNLGASNANATYAGTITDNGAGTTAVTKGGGGIQTLSGNSTYSGGTTVTGGTLAITRALALGTGPVNLAGGNIATSSGIASALRFPSLNISGGQFDLNDNDMILDYIAGNSPAGTIRGYLSSGYANGAWNGSGLASTAANTNASLNTALGYADAADIGITQFDGLSITGPAVLVKYTYYGDSSLDGKVDLGNDFNLFLIGFLSPSGSDGTSSSGPRRLQLRWCNRHDRLRPVHRRLQEPERLARRSDKRNRIQPAAEQRTEGGVARRRSRAVESCNHRRRGGGIARTPPEAIAVSSG